MTIAIIDADLIGRAKHRFPNLACMKLSAYYKEQGASVTLITKYDQEELQRYDKIFLSKVFTDTPYPEWLLTLPNVEYGGTGFFYDKAPKLPDNIEHHMPDYHLYDEWVNQQLSNGGKRKDYEYYLDYSIGFTTRGCFRQCPFCVNQNYTAVCLHSPIEEFLDPSRRYICLLDDNVFGSPHWKEIIEALKATKKPFIFRQGLDERLLTEEKCKTLSECMYIKNYCFAFDNIEDKALITSKFEMLQKYLGNKHCNITFYVLCGFDRNNKYNQAFWEQDIKDTFERIFLLGQAGFYPYIMRFNRYEESPYRGIYIVLARWCNQPNFFTKYSFYECCIYFDKYDSGGKMTSSSIRYLELAKSLNINHYIYDKPKVNIRKQINDTTTTSI